MKRFKTIALFLVVVAFARLWIAVDQFFLPHAMLFPVFVVVICLLMAGYYAIIRPIDVRRFSLTLGGCTGGAVAILSLVQHVVLGHDFALYLMRLLRIFIIASCLPPVIGWVYWMAARPPHLNSTSGRSDHTSVAREE